MKKFVLVSLVAALMSNYAVADMYIEKVNDCDEVEMRAALDRASADKKAVITIVECDNGVVRTVQKGLPAVRAKTNHSDCRYAQPKQQVVKREYFVRETVQTYKPVVTYVPDGTYTRVKPACEFNCF